MFLMTNQSERPGGQGCIQATETGFLSLIGGRGTDPVALLSRQQPCLLVFLVALNIGSDGFDGAFVHPLGSHV